MCEKASCFISINENPNDKITTGLNGTPANECHAAYCKIQLLRQISFCNCIRFVTDIQGIDPDSSQFLLDDREVDSSSKVILREGNLPHSTAEDRLER